MSTEFSQEEEVILRAAGYEEMKLDSSVIVSYVNGEWRRVDTVTSYFVDRVCKVTKNTFGPSFALSSTAGVLRVSNGGSETAKRRLEANFFTTSVGAEYLLLYKGSNAKLTLVEGDISGVSYHVGFGVSTGAGIKDNAIQLKLIGCGFSVGRRISISVLDNEFGLDFGKCKTQ